MADSAFQKGLPLVQSKKLSGCRRLSVQEEEKEEDGKVDKDKGEGPGTGEEEGAGSGIEGLSCATLTWENSLSSTMDKADHLKG